MQQCQQHHSDSPLDTRASARHLARWRFRSHPRWQNSPVGARRSSRSSAVPSLSRFSGLLRGAKGTRQHAVIGFLPCSPVDSSPLTCSASTSLFRCLAWAWPRWYRMRRSSSLASTPPSWGSARQGVPSRRSRSPSSGYSCSPRWWIHLREHSTCRPAVTPPSVCSGASAQRPSTASTW